MLNFTATGNTDRGHVFRFRSGDGVKVGGGVVELFLDSSNFHYFWVYRYKI